MTRSGFTARLEQAAGKHPPSRARRIAALLPQIEAAMAQGLTRAHIVTALLELGICVSPHQLSNAIARLRKQRQGASSWPMPMPVPMPALDLRAGAKTAVALAPCPCADPSVSQPTSVPALAPSLLAALNAGPAAAGSPSKFGAHDPRLLDEVMRSTPDMKALAKLAPKVPR